MPPLQLLHTSIIKAQASYLIRVRQLSIDRDARRDVFMSISLPNWTVVTNKRTQLHRHGKVNKGTKNTLSQLAAAVWSERINVTLSRQAVYIKSHCFYLGSARKCCNLAQCRTSSTCLRLGFVWFWKEKRGNFKKKMISTFGNFNNLFPMTYNERLFVIRYLSWRQSDSSANLSPWYGMYRTVRKIFVCWWLP